MEKSTKLNGDSLIYLPDTSLKLSTLKQTLSEIYNLEIKNKIDKMDNTGYCIIRTMPKEREQMVSGVLPIDEVSSWLQNNCSHDCGYELHICDKDGNNLQEQTKFADGGFVKLTPDKLGNNWLFPKGAKKKTYGIQLLQGGDIKKAEQLRTKQTELKEQKSSILRVDGYPNAVTRRITKDVAKLEKQIAKYDDGGNVEDDEEAGFEEIENKIETVPTEVREIINRYEENWDETYENCEAFQKELEEYGYTISYGLDAVPYNFRKIKMETGGIVSKKEAKNITPDKFYKYEYQSKTDNVWKELKKTDNPLSLMNYGYILRLKEIYRYAGGGGVGKKKKTDFTIAEFIQVERDKLRNHNAQSHEDDRLDWSDWKSELTKEDTKEYGIYYNNRMLDQNGDKGVFEYLPTNKNYNEEEYATGGGIPERYKTMGFTKVGEKKNSTNPEKKWMVLAKKGEEYKIVHGGYKGMEDYTQHHDENRRKRFWQRMGGINSSKANDPFSPLYWHKKFGTWEQGGGIPEKYGEQAKPRVIEDEGAGYTEQKGSKKTNKQSTVREIQLKLKDVDIPTKKIGSSRDVFEFVNKIWDRDAINIQEDFCVLYLNRANKIVSYQKLSRGGVAGVVADVEMIVGTASKALATGVIIVHNHPSGNLMPSPADKQLTSNLKSALKLIDVTLLDSMIVSPEYTYYSFADEGILYKLGGNITPKQKFVQGKIKKVMKEFGKGELKTSAGKKVTNVKQAVAIGYSEGRSGWKHKRK